MQAWVRGYEDSVQPVVVLEMRMLMRGLRGPLALFLCAALPIGLALALLFTRVTEPRYSAEEMERLGRAIFQWLLLLEVGIVVVLAPLLAAGMIAREYHRQTLEAALLTRLSIGQLLTGKLLVTVGLLAVALGGAVPAIAVVFLLGGVSPWELGSALFLLALLAGYQAAIALFCVIRFHSSVAGTLVMIPLTALGAAAPWLLPLLPLALPQHHQRRRWRARYTRELITRWLLLLGLSLTALPFALPLLGPLCPAAALGAIAAGASHTLSGWWPALFAALMLLIGTHAALARAAGALQQRQYEPSERYAPDSPV